MAADLRNHEFRVMRTAQVRSTYDPASRLCVKLRTVQEGNSVKAIAAAYRRPDGGLCVPIDPRGFIDAEFLENFPWPGSDGAAQVAPTPAKAEQTLCLDLLLPRPSASNSEDRSVPEQAQHWASPKGPQESWSTKQASGALRQAQNETWHKEKDGQTQPWGTEEWRDEASQNWKEGTQTWEAAEGACQSMPGRSRRLGRSRKPGKPLKEPPCQCQSMPGRSRRLGRAAKPGKRLKEPPCQCQTMPGRSRMLGRALKKSPSYRSRQLFPQSC
ncbi:unnamed protein product [Effrenium voratum]|uniref:Uncharacterized protein n=1 Tax=Effrenium voratum TaxID=2562239 RepID=A0AA36I7K8_9DINO|nr:unnamed protein product [Effrenium voratum]